MKKQSIKMGILIALFLLSIRPVSAQKADTSISRTSNQMYERYLRRHKTFKTAGWVFLAPGASLVLVGLGYITSPNARTSGGFFTKFEVGEIFIAGGVLFALPSVPLFIIAGNNAKKARTAKLQLTTGTIPALNKCSYAALSLKINL